MTNQQVEFENIKQEIKKIISKGKKITNKTCYQSAGIYMLYVDNFEDETVIPFYIGQTIDFQARHKEHMNELLSLNRLQYEYYINLLVEGFYNSRYKACKFFKYMVDHGCTLKDIHMVVVKDINNDNDELLQEQLLDEERRLIANLKSSFFGFNQYQSITDGFNNEVRTTTLGYDIVEVDLKNAVKYINYGYNYINSFLCYGGFSDKSDSLELLLENENFKTLIKAKNRIRELELKKAELNNTYNNIKESIEDLLYENVINVFFEKNGLKSSSKKIDLCKGIINGNDYTKEVVDYINRFSKKDKFEVLDCLCETFKKQYVLLFDSFEEIINMYWETKKRNI